MATSVRLDDEFVGEIKIISEVSYRSVPKQIQHFAKIGQIAEENSDLSYNFIKDALLAHKEIDEGLATKYERRTKNT